MSAFADYAVLHGADGQVEGIRRPSCPSSDSSSSFQRTLSKSRSTTSWQNDAHTVVLQTTKAQLDERQLADRVVYVFHMDEDGLIRDACFNGDPRVQEDFYGLS